MRRVRLGFLAWLLFALACLVPGWFLCERIAAEVQIQNAYPPIGRAHWRHLREPGIQHLCDVVFDGGLDRQMRAAWLLQKYSGRLVWRAKLRAIPQVDSRVLGELWPLNQALLVDGIGVAYRETDEGVLRAAILRPLRGVDRGFVLIHMWIWAPDVAERVVSSTLRTTVDPAQAQRVSSYNVGFGYGYLATDLDTIAPQTREARVRAVRAGLENPDPRIRSICKRALAELLDKPGSQR